MEGIGTVSPGTVSVAELSLLDDRVVALGTRERAYLDSQGSGEGLYRAGSAEKFGLSSYIDREDGMRFRYGDDGDWLDMPTGLKELSPYFIREPDFTGSGETIEAAREAYGPIAERMNDYLADTFGAILSYGSLEVGEMEPMYMMTGDGRIAKVLGLYSSETNQIFLSNDLEGEEVSEVFEHELLHYAQDRFGVIGRYLEEDPANARERIEEDVERAQDYINRNYPMDDMPEELDHSRVARPASLPGYRPGSLAA